MSEKGTKRREWVKNVAIIFLTVLLILTFFSRTIQNYSLPEVAAQYVQSGTITAKIRGTGTVESGDPYEVNVTETRKVASVAVKAGDTVQEGDVLVYLEDSESEELKTAQKALTDAREAYDKAIVQKDVESGMVQESNNVSTTSYRQQLNAAQRAVKNAQNEVNRLQRESTNLTGNASNELLEAYRSAQNAMNDATAAATAAKNHYDNIVAQYDYYSGILEDVTVSGGNLLPTDMTLEDVEKRVNELAQQQIDAQRAMLDTQASAANATLNCERAKANLDSSQASANGSLEVAKALLADEERKLEELSARINTVLGIEGLYTDLQEAQEAYDEALEKSVDSVITAKIAGTVTTMNAVAGKEVSAATPVAILQPEGKGYSMSFTVTNEQAQRLSVGDRADLVNSWRYDDVEVTLANIRPDTTNPGANKLLTFNVTGSVTAGQSLSVSVGQRSANYDAIVPNSAIREDNNGKFVLVVESKSSPLGNRYIATRMSVEVQASDDTQSAVSGLSGSEFVITTSTKPVEAGQLVRLANNS